MDQFDVIVIGGGPGGYTAAIQIAKKGKRVALIEQSNVGGTCLNCGCISVKSLLYSAELFSNIQRAHQFGIYAENISYSYKKIIDNKNQVVGNLRLSIEFLLNKLNITLIRETGKLINDHEVQAGSSVIFGKYIIIATGMTPQNINIQGADHPNVFNSDRILNLEECPENIVIIGGGVIGIEFASIFASLNKSVTIIESTEQILHGFDAQICNMIKQSLEKQNVKFYMKSEVIKIINGSSCIFKTQGTAQTVSGNTILLAIGRKPVIESTGIKDLGIVTTDGFIKVNNEMRTPIPHIFAIGDITGKGQLAHLASAQAIIAANNICNLHQEIDYSTIPFCIYTNPEIAYIGYSEKQSRELNYQVKIGISSAASNGRSVVMGSTYGIAKLVVDAKTDKILGCQLMAARATDLISEIGIIMKHGITARELCECIHPHPTVSEMILEAAQDVYGLCTHKLLR